MNILNICQRDYAGVGIALTRAVQQYAKKHKARHLCMQMHRFRYDTDIVTRNPAEIHKWVRWADVVNTHVRFRPIRQGQNPPKPKSLLITYHGTHYRAKHEMMHLRARKLGAKKSLCTTIDLTKFGVAEWLPTAIPVDRYAEMRRKHGGKPVVCQAPSNPKRKNSAEIRELLGNREDIQLLIVHHRPHNQILRRIAAADVFIDRFRLGLGVSGLEALAMGIPVIADASPQDEKLIIKEVGYLPYYKASLQGLVEAVETLLSDKALYKEYVERGNEYIRDFHDYPIVAKRYMEIIERMRGRPSG